ncbi:GntR family transcriptional regulator [Tsukamurella paurometabola]|uniref:Pyruvate dehydrogenase complex repressor n=1 Tax=Tsukamurella paurometabola TaxID=2061 RepID=A0A3P8KG32_TSUPA|nr:GntR family transcriptional regulator [Tsukamurella paurometabola]UEA81970.1 GntR family transcriptional regulator [Tsukamurella paurometabola]VDR38998.1 Pyruvate dehydrogenase complex repressor [Tsukamurella paurometabola]
MTAPRIGVDESDPTPAFEQIRRQITGHIASGALPVGAKLPPLRQLARDLGIAVGTAAHAYRELEATGLIESRRGGGTRVIALPSPDAASTFDAGALREAAARYVAAARRLDAPPQAALDAVMAALRGENDGAGPAD